MGDKKRRDGVMEQHQTVTVAICTYNRCELLEQTLENLTRVQRPALGWSILVVDNNSSDNTASVVERFAARLPIRRVFETTPGLSNARNCAMREAQSDYVLFTDDDVLVDDRWLVEFVETAKRYPSAAAIGGPIAPWFPIAPDERLLDAYYWLQSGLCGLDHQLPEGPLPKGEYVFGANFAIRCDRATRIRFDPALGPIANAPGGGDEITFLDKLIAAGEVIVWSPAMRVRHYVAPSRMAEPYLRQFAYQKGRTQTLSTMAGFDAQWFGAPRWLWKQYAQVALSSIMASTGIALRLPDRLRSGPKPARDTKELRRMVWNREERYVRGELAALREAASTRDRSPASRTRIVEDVN